MANLLVAFVFLAWPALLLIGFGWAAVRRPKEDRCRTFGKAAIVIGLLWLLASVAITLLVVQVDTTVG